MRLVSLRLTNFKGIHDFTLKANGEDVTVYGDNEAGKTTLFDALTWLLFDKDGRNKKDFEIKTLDENNQPLHGLNHEAEGVFNLDGRQLTLRKVYAEKWTKKRGAAKAVFSGHTVDHFIDGVPVKKGEYETKIAAIIPENIFKLLTSPLYFNEQLHWAERRKLLLEVCGDISDTDVIASSGDLAELTNIIPSGRTLDEHKAVIAARRAEINKELGKIPVRIDEVTRSLPDIAGIDAKKLPTDIANLKYRKQQKEQELVRIESGGEVAERRRQLAEIEAEILRLTNDHREQSGKAVNEKHTQLFTVNGHVRNYQLVIDDIKRRIDRIHAESGRLAEEMKKKREEWFTINAQTLEYEQDTTCPTCGQDLPEEQLMEAREKAQADFNVQKAEKLSSISAQGQRFKTEIEVLTGEHNNLLDKLRENENLLIEKEAEGKRLQAEIEALSGQKTSLNPSYIQKLQQRQNITNIITQLQNSISEAVEGVSADIFELSLAIVKKESETNKIRLRKDGGRRIKELEAQEKELAAEYERMEKELYLTEQFTRAKVQLMDEKINSKFRFARFKMFEQQVNGGLADCCETLYKGVPYNSNLNAGHRIIVGMDIIRTLSEHYRFTAPIFIDNAESVTDLPEMDAQVIRLIKPEIVTEKDREKYNKLVVKTGSKNTFRRAI